MPAPVWTEDDVEHLLSKYRDDLSEQVLKNDRTEYEGLLDRDTLTLKHEHLPLVLEGDLELEEQ